MRWSSPTVVISGTERLILSERGLEALPAEGLHAGLRVLDIAHNRLSALPDEVATLRELDVLYLGDNALTAVPPTLARLERLLYIDLRANRLAELPDGLGDLEALEKLDLRWNPLAADPPLVERLRARGCRVLT